jgi:hypothetical protein
MTRARARAYLCRNTTIQQDADRGREQYKGRVQVFRRISAGWGLIGGLVISAIVWALTGHWPTKP